MLGDYTNTPGMAYLEADGWSLRKTVYIWGRSVENVEWAMRGAFSKNTDFTNAHGWVFSRIGYSCAAFSGVFRCAIGATD